MATRLIFHSAAAGVLLLASVVALAQQQRSPAASGEQAIAVADERAAIVLSEEESAFIRREMRGLLESVREILDASGAGDRARLAQAARRAGLNGPEAEHIPKSLAPKLPPEFKKLGLATHRGFDQIAADMEQSGTTDRARKQLVDLMGNCTACHSTWRLVGESRR